MKLFKSLDLLEQLQSDVRQIIAAAKFLQKDDPAILLRQPEPGKWSVIQVLEHLNSYGRYYLPEIERSLQSSKPATEDFKSGWIGNYFTNLMKPNSKGQVGKKMKAPRDHSPSTDLDPKPTLDTFIQQQHALLELLEKAKKKNIGLIRTPISISKLIRLKLGDTFRFLVAHEQRHFVQIQNVFISLKEVRDIYRVAQLAV